MGTQASRPALEIDQRMALGGRRGEGSSLVRPQLLLLGTYGVDCDGYGPGRLGPGDVGWSAQSPVRWMQCGCECCGEGEGRGLSEQRPAGERRLGEGVASAKALRQADLLQVKGLGGHDDRARPDFLVGATPAVMGVKGRDLGKRKGGLQGKAGAPSAALSQGPTLTPHPAPPRPIHQGRPDVSLRPVDAADASPGAPQTLRPLSTTQLTGSPSPAPAPPMTSGHVGHGCHLEPGSDLCDLSEETGKS